MLKLKENPFCCNIVIIIIMIIIITISSRTQCTLWVFAFHVEPSSPGQTIMCVPKNFRFAYWYQNVIEDRYKAFKFPIFSVIQKDWTRWFCEPVWLPWRVCVGGWVRVCVGGWVRVPLSSAAPPRKGKWHYNDNTCHSVYVWVCMCAIVTRGR